MTGPRYTDQEMALILKRAATLQSEDDGGKHSLNELQTIAAEVGISADLVARAAAEIEAGKSSSRLLGEATSYHAAATIPVTLSPGANADLVALIRRTVNDPGTLTPLDHGFEWQRNTGYSSLTVSVAQQGVATTVRVDGDVAGNRTMLYLVPTVAAGVVGLIVGGGVGRRCIRCTRRDGRRLGWSAHAVGSHGAPSERASNTSA